MAILVTGGAGYIGSVVVEQFIQQGLCVVVVDTLQDGHREAVSPAALFYQGDIEDGALLDRVFQERPIQAVAHFAAEVSVPESVTDPAKYFGCNVVKGIALLNAMRRHGCDRLIFSSTAAIFGEPQYSPIDEAHPQDPINPYGESKRVFERVLLWYHRAYGLRFNTFRYFNAAGASQMLGEDHAHEGHLIPLVLQVALAKRPHIQVFGSDYDTPDGTCVRDYIHVVDLAQAHVLALENLDRHPAAQYNLGNGGGYSVLEVIRTAEAVTGRSIPVRQAPRRPGDAAVLVASSQLAHRQLGWRPQHPDLEQIVRSAWDWHRAHPNGYGT